MHEKRLLQMTVALACVVPLSAGLWGMTSGLDMLHTTGDGFAQGHYRYLSGLLCGIGLGFLTCLPNLERRGDRVQLLSAIVLVGGLARLVDMFVNGMSGGMVSNAATLFALLMELGVTPALCLWQWRYARRVVMRG